MTSRHILEIYRKKILKKSKQNNNKEVNAANIQICSRKQKDKKNTT